MCMSEVHQNIGFYHRKKALKFEIISQAFSAPAEFLIYIQNRQYSKHAARGGRGGGGLFIATMGSDRLENIFHQVNMHIMWCGM